jgi:hypothetical protein
MVHFNSVICSMMKSFFKYLAGRWRISGGETFAMRKDPNLVMLSNRALVKNRVAVFDQQTLEGP